MKRMHIHVGVTHLDQGIKFYSALFLSLIHISAPTRPY